MPWRQMLLRGTPVLARCDERGELRADGGRVEIRYKRTGSKAYQAAARNLSPGPDPDVLPDDFCDDAEAAPPSSPKGAAKKKSSAKKAPAKVRAPEEGAVVVYADGACSGNPGPAGLGVVLIDGDAREELSEYLGKGTNNIAELTGILRAAEKLRGRDAPIRIYTDSQYSIGVLTKGWKAKKNQELIREVEAALAALDDVELRYVPGHAGHALNERADELARAAIVARATSGWVRP